MNNTTNIDTQENQEASKAKDDASRNNDVKQSSAMSNSSASNNPNNPEANIEQAFFFGLTIDDALNSSENLPELFYNACKYNHLELVKRCVEEKHINVNELYANDYPLCIASHKGHIEVVRFLLAHGADIRVRREINSTTARGNHRLVRSNALPVGEGPLSLAVKYGFEDLAIELVEKGAPILNENHEFEKSPLQDAIRLNRGRALSIFIEKLKQTRAQPDDDESLLLEKKGDILRQCLINDQIDALRIFVPYIWEELNSDFMCIVLTNLMLKNKIQSDKAFDVLEAILEAIPVSKLKMYDIGDLLKRFLHILQAQFHTISDDRIQILNLRTSLLYTILKYHEPIDFTNYLNLIDVYFLAIYSSVENAGDGVNQIYEYIVRFYENLILMGHLILSNSAVILKLLDCNHVQRMQQIDMYLSWRARNPFLLKERCRLMIKDRLGSYKRTTLEKLNLNDDAFYYLYYQR